MRPQRQAGRQVEAGGKPAGAHSRQAVGGKASALALMAQAGIPVPEFFVVAPKVFEAFLHENGIGWASAVGDGSDGDWVAVRRKIRASPLSAALRGPILDGYERLCRADGDGRVAVRSSGAEEDSAGASFAGRFDSFLNIDGDGLLQAVKDCWASVVSDRSLHYRTAHGQAVASRPAFSVIVQRQLFPHKAGVVFTEHPLDADLGVYIEANFGTGESVVRGIVTPDRATVARSGDATVVRVTAVKRRMTVVSPDGHGSRVVEPDDSQARSEVLSDAEVGEVSQMALRVEGIMGAPQDIEWAYDAQQLWVLQSRPITATVR